MAANEFDFVPDDTGTEPASNSFGFIPDEAPSSNSTRMLRPNMMAAQALQYNNPKTNPLVDMYEGTLAAGQGVKRGLERFGAGINQFLLPGIDKVLGSDLAAKDQAYQQAADAEFEEKYGGNPAGIAGAFIGETAPMFTPMGIASKAGAAGKFTQAHPVLSQLGKLTGLGALQGAITYDPGYETPVTEKALVGGGLGLATGGLLNGVPGAYNALKKLPAKLIGDISPAEMQAAIETHKGLKTGLGDIINSPSLKYTRDNLLEDVPFSGVRQNQISVGKQLTSEAENILNKLKPKEMPENFGKDITDALTKQKIERQTIKNQNYKEANEFADAIGAKVNPKNYMQQINSELSNIDNLILPSAQKNELKDILKNASNFKSFSLGESLGSSPAGESFKKTYLTKGYLNNAYEDALKNNDTTKLALVNRLRGALKQDVAESVEKSGSQELQNKFKKAEDYYKNDYGKFKDSDILKFTNRGGDPDTVENYFLQSGKNDKSGKLSKLMDLLPEDMNKTLGYRYLANAYKDKKFGSDELDPIQLSKIYNSLGERTRKRLFPYKDIQKDMEKLSARLEKNQEALNAMVNPKTGSRIGDWVGIGASSMLGGLPSLGARVAEKALTSEKIRDIYLRSLLRQ